MTARKSRALWTLCALVAFGCGGGGIPLPFVEDKDDEDKDPNAPVFTLKAKVRDFKEGNASSPDGTHPHFNHTTYTCEAKAQGATVLGTLDTNGRRDDQFPGDNRTPRLADNMTADLARCFSPAELFGDWYEDRDASVNRPYLITMRWTRTGGGTYLFREDQFFPLDNGSQYSKRSSAEPEPFGHLQLGTKDEADLSQHNYGFTLEVHGRFKYEAGKAQTMWLRGDDDLWVFVDGKPAVDLGGTHPAQADTLEMDGLGLTNGQTYHVDIYFAERSVASSRLHVETNFKITPLK